MNETAGVGAFLAAVAGLGMIFILIGVGLWILKSIGLSQMAKKRGIENEWLAWLPVADLYIMGTIVEEMNLFGIQINNLGLWFPVISLFGGLLSSIPILGIILFIGVLVFQIAFIYKLFSLYTDQATIYTVLCVFFAFLWPIFIFTLRNNSVLSEEIASMDRENDPQDDSALQADISPDVFGAELIETDENVVDDHEETQNEMNEELTETIKPIDN